MLPALLGLSIAVTLVLPATFFVAAPVRERRAVLGLTYLTVVVMAWCAALLLGFLSPLAAASAATILCLLAVLAGVHTWRDEALLAELDAALADPHRRAEALARLRARLALTGRDTRAVVALMEVAGFPARRLVARGHYQEAGELLEFIEEELGARLGRVDRSELHLLQARVALHLGEVDEARALLSLERQEGSAFPGDAALLEALVASVRGDAAEAGAQLEGAKIRLGSEWSRSLAHLVGAHVAASRGEDAQALAELHALRPSYRRCLLALARAVPGPASQLARRVDGEAQPYR